MCLLRAYSQLQGLILKSLQTLKLTDSDLSTGYCYPAFQQLGPGVHFHTTLARGISFMLVLDNGKKPSLRFLDKKEDKRNIILKRGSLFFFYLIVMAM